MVNIQDLRVLAKRRLPRAVFDYIDGGAEAEVTLRENCRVFEDVALRPRSAVATPRLRSRHDRPRHTARPAGPARPGRQLPDVLPARRGRRGPRRRPGRHGLRAVDAVGHAPRGGEGGHERAVLVPGVPVRRAATWRSPRSPARTAAGFSALVVDHRHAGRRACASATCATASRSSWAATRWPMLPFVWQLLARPRWLVGFFADGGLMKFPNVDAAGRPDALRRRRRRARAIGRLLGRPRAGFATPGTGRSW